VAGAAFGLPRGILHRGHTLLIIVVMFGMRDGHHSACQQYDSGKQAKSISKVEQHGSLLNS
jgi:hypothetical protein